MHIENAASDDQSSEDEPFMFLTDFN